MTIKIGINGFGRMGRLALRAAWDWPELEFVHINEPAGDIASAAHLLKYDSVHRTWPHEVSVDGDKIVIDGKAISYSQNSELEASPWAESSVDVLLECSGKFKAQQALAPCFDIGIKKVVVSAPIKDGTLNIVMGVNDHLYRADTHHVVTAASCTTNCLAPVVDVIQKKLGIKHGSFTTIHDITNTQSILDEYHSDLRRARASGLSLIPTTTGSATAIAEIFPELEGRLNGIAVRVPLANASLTDCVFEVARPTSVEFVNKALQEAANGRLAGILGYEERPLVSVDYTDDTRSSIIDAPSTMVINKTQVKILAWYDNEIGYVNRMMELALKVGRSIASPGE
ncbi:MAG: ArsJ-associated glyceraldehyde-3-phosphate dehydrogenase [Gammaproteobacteria bacterium]|nr:ArsJ-associated glyceraldehyde-3-phosphate dehydrogenase [Gammaproteobacteria bacterium]MBQ0838980.1 ArsJ-associated glyceraldehyde-3-phosphate dehydrogenase [Gammaproteobacteria bacterium]